jgi:hypothetical protein
MTTDNSELVKFNWGGPTGKRQQPFPGFNLGPTGETSYQTYHRGFKDGWNAGKVTI